MMPQHVLQGAICLHWVDKGPLKSTRKKNKAGNNNRLFLLLASYLNGHTKICEVKL